MKAVFANVNSDQTAVRLAFRPDRAEILLNKISVIGRPQHMPATRYGKFLENG